MYKTYHTDLRPFSIDCDTGRPLVAIELDLTLINLATHTSTLPRITVEPLLESAAGISKTKTEAAADPRLAAFSILIRLTHETSKNGTGRIIHEVRQLLWLVVN